MEFIFGMLLIILFLFILLAIIESGVRRGIDNSETGKLIRRFLMEKLNAPSAISDEETEKKLEEKSKSGD